MDKPKKMWINKHIIPRNTVLCSITLNEMQKNPNKKTKGPIK